jgi:hypothetical protein
MHRSKTSFDHPVGGRAMSAAAEAQRLGRLQEPVDERQVQPTRLLRWRIASSTGSRFGAVLTFKPVIVGLRLADDRRAVDLRAGDSVPLYDE